MVPSDPRARPRTKAPRSAASQRDPFLQPRLHFAHLSRAHRGQRERLLPVASQQRQHGFSRRLADAMGLDPADPVAFAPLGSVRPAWRSRRSVELSARSSNWAPAPGNAMGGGGLRDRGPLATPTYAGTPPFSRGGREKDDLLRLAPAVGCMRLFGSPMSTAKDYAAASDWETVGGGRIVRPASRSCCSSDLRSA